MTSAHRMRVERTALELEEYIEDLLVILAADTPADLIVETSLSPAATFLFSYFVYSSRNTDLRLGIDVETATILLERGASRAAL